MSHFVEARNAVIAALREAPIATSTMRVCLLVDLQGRMRVLAQPEPAADRGALETELKTSVRVAADIFWSDEIWLQTDRDGQAKKAVYEQVWKEARPEPPGQSKLFVLDRHLSKDSWLGASIEAPWPLNEHTAPILSFYSFKGGVGRTTTLLALAVNLSRSGKKVVVLDFDLEAPGAGGALEPPNGVPPGLGLLDFLLDSAVAPKGSLEIGDFYHRFDDKAVIGDGEPIAVVPSGVLDRWYLEKLARVNYEYIYQTATDPGSLNSPLHQMLRSLRSKLQPDFFLVDSRAGLHDLGGLTLSGLAHLHVLFGLDSSQSWDGLGLVISRLGRDMVLAGRAQRDCAIVHSMVRSGVGRDEELRRFKERSFQVFSENYYDPADFKSGEWPLPDPESIDSPHFPMSLSWNERVKGFSSLAAVVDVLTADEHKKVSEQILDKVDRTL